MPIGLPLPGQKTMVLDTDCNRCGPGADGELCVAGSQVTDGYWGRPDLTAERFPTFPHLAPGVRSYRTGDHARTTADYGLVYLGRVDRQVKVGGHRVELLEVEAAPRRISGASSVAAIAWPVDPNGLVRGIVAFVADETVASDAVLQACRHALPPYMVPSRLYLVADWPVSDSGKTDYARLRRIMEQDNESNRKATELADDPVMLLLLATLRRHLDTFGIPPTTLNRDTNFTEAAVIDLQALLDLIFEVENGCGRTFDPLRSISRVG